MSNQPWASGPGEILQHGLSLLKKDSDKNRRLALLTIDNSVELMIKTFLSLPKRVTGIYISRKDYSEISESFPRLLDAIERYANDKLNGINLGEIEWYHRIRNELYHQGNGLTVEKNKVEVYAELAKLLFRNLFDIDIVIEVEESEKQELIGKYLNAWLQVENILREIANRVEPKITNKIPNMYLFRNVTKVNGFDSNTVDELIRLREIRNGVVHGDVETINNLSSDQVQRLIEAKFKLEQFLLRI